MAIHPLSGLAAQVAHAADVTQRGRLLNRLHNEVREALASGRDDLLRHATANVISPVAGWILLDALDHVINTPAVASSARAARVFAIPVVLVVAGPAQVPGVFPDTKGIARLLENHDALGPAHSFCLSQALCPESSLEADSPSQRYALLRGVESASVEVRPDMIPAPIYLESADERVHLRFLVGGIVASALERAFPETVGDIRR
jgi:hypothetical protein